MALCLLILTCDIETLIKLICYLSKCIAEISRHYYYCFLLLGFYFPLVYIYYLSFTIENIKISLCGTYRIYALFTFSDKTILKIILKGIEELCIDMFSLETKTTK